jgi:hypothetical protein
MSETRTPATFLDECLRGRALLADVDDWVDRWHEASGAPYGASIPLRDFLGLSQQEYAMWVEQPGSLRFAAAARRAAPVGPSAMSVRSLRPPSPLHAPATTRRLAP